MDSVVTCLLLLVTWTDHAHSDILNMCKGGRFYKSSPGPEPALTGECVPWRSRACCTANTTVAFHTNDTAVFNWNHCPPRQLSSACRTWFLRDLCFYECSPNQGPWVQQNQRLNGIPLCRSECSAWWAACMNDYTCLEDWKNDFDWTTGINVCPADAQCRPFTDVFRNATTFCEDVWDHTFRVVPDGDPCITMQFNGTNPNDAVTRLYARSSAETLSFGSFGVLSLLVVRVVFVLTLSM